MKDTKKLTKPQAELLQAMKGGTVVYLIGARVSSYFFRNDTFKHCTKQAQGLIDRGLIEAYDVDWKGSKYKPSK